MRRHASGIALLSKRFPLALAKNRVTIGGAIMASLGTAIICLVRSTVLPLDHSFAHLQIRMRPFRRRTTVVFFRSVALFGTLPPHRPCTGLPNRRCFR